MRRNKKAYCFSTYQFIKTAISHAWPHGCRILPERNDLF